MQEECRELSNFSHDNEYICYLLSEITNEVQKKRIAHELVTYSRKARFYKKMYLLSQSIIILLPVLIVGMQLLGEQKNAALFLTASITAVSGLANVFALQDKWKHYRTYCELMKQEVNEFLLGIGVYEKVEQTVAGKLLGNRIETMITAEGEQWKHFVSNRNSVTKDSEEEKGK